MEGQDGFDPDQDDDRTSGWSTSAVNERYYAFINNDGLSIYGLPSSSYSAYRYDYASRTSSVLPILEFSPADPDLLALVQRETVAIFDLKATSLKCVLSGIGRTVTCISFHPGDPSIIAVGATDGTIRVYYLEDPAQSISKLRGNGRACRQIAFHPSYPDLLAFVTKSDVSIWRVQSIRSAKVADIEAHWSSWLAWYPESNQKLISISRNGALLAWDTEPAIKAANGMRTTEDGSSDEKSLLWGLEVPHNRQCSSLNFVHNVRRAKWIGRNGLLVIPHHRRAIFFHSLSLDSNSSKLTWAFDPGHVTDDVGICIKDDISALIICCGAELSSHRIPNSVLPKLGSQDSTMPAPPNLGKDAQIRKPVVSTNITMRLNSVRDARRRSRYLRRRPMRHMTVHDHEDNRDPEFLESKEESETEDSSSLSMASSLQLPRANIENTNLFTPPLSSITPTRKFSETNLAALDEGTHLPSAVESKPESLSVNPDDESDSDDDELAGHMHGSASFLPGGVNVPLPKKCGAVFGPSGDLLIFMPMKSIVISALDPKDTSDTHVASTGPSAEISKFFPTFRNLTPSSKTLDRLSKHGALRTGGIGLPSDSMPAFAVKAAPENMQSIVASYSPTKRTAAPWPVEEKISVRVFAIQSLFTTNPDHAGANAFLLKDGQSEADVCHTNARMATNVGLFEVADIWQSLALNVTGELDRTKSFDGYGSPIEDGSGFNETLAGPDAAMPIAHGINGGIDLEAPYRSRHPFESSWAAEKYLDWAEQRSDIIVLANMSAIWARTAKQIDQQRKAVVRPATLHRSTASSKGFRESPGGFDDANAQRSAKIPLLRANSGDSVALSDSPEKRRLSRGSSRDASSPNSPFPDSRSGTPPTRFPPVLRTSTQLSTSGSASPEARFRSSFSATAKHYAQSITDKFAVAVVTSHGASPPPPSLKKSSSDWPTGERPELSSSLPITVASSSWSKSVSFASTANGSHGSLTLSQRESHDSDSTRTIDNDAAAAAPPHRRSPSQSSRAPIWKDSLASALDPSRRSLPQSSTSTVLSPATVQKCRLWCHHYAEHLRARGSLIDARGLEKLLGVEPARDPSSSTTTTTIATLDEAAVVPQVDAGRRFATCAVCFCAIHAAQLLCPTCLHASHLDCLQALVLATGGDGFSCPAGCGCDCTATAAAAVAMAAVQPDDSPNASRFFDSRTTTTTTF